MDTLFDGPDAVLSVLTSVKRILDLCTLATAPNAASESRPTRPAAPCAAPILTRSAGRSRSASARDCRFGCPRACVAPSVAAARRGSGVRSSQRLVFELARTPARARGGPSLRLRPDAPDPLSPLPRVSDRGLGPRARDGRRGVVADGARRYPVTPARVAPQPRYGRTPSLVPRGTFRIRRFDIGCVDRRQEPSPLVSRGQFRAASQRTGVKKLMDTALARYAPKSGEPAISSGLVRVSDGTRTHDRLDHNQELYQLSYAHRGVSNLALPRAGFGPA
jgi:hypothetical protein